MLKSYLPLILLLSYISQILHPTYSPNFLFSTGFKPHKSPTTYASCPSDHPCPCVTYAAFTVFPLPTGGAGAGNPPQRQETGPVIETICSNKDMLLMEKEGGQLFTPFQKFSPFMVFQMCIQYVKR